MKRTILTSLAVGMSILMATAQVDFPQPSPLCKVEQVVGLTNVTLEYSRPGVKDREIYGGLVPYGEMWRTGANASTKIGFDTDVKLSGQKVEKGKYALYTIPGEAEWTIIIHGNTSHWGVGGDDYKAEEDVLRFTVKPKRIPSKIESMTIQIGNLRSGSATIDLVWENTLVSIPMTVDTRGTVQKDLEEAMAGPSGRLYYQAARFYLDNGSELETALSHINTAINEKDYERFWSLRVKSLIQAELGDYKGAIATAEKSKAMAMEEDNADYVRMNEKSIAEWSEK